MHSAQRRVYSSFWVSHLGPVRPLPRCRFLQSTTPPTCCSGTIPQTGVGRGGGAPLRCCPSSPMLACIGRISLVTVSRCGCSRRGGKVFRSADDVMLGQRRRLFEHLRRAIWGKSSAVARISSIILKGLGRRYKDSHGLEARLPCP